METEVVYRYHNGNRSISSEQLFEATRALFTVKDADGNLTVAPRSLPPLLTFILVPLIPRAKREIRKADVAAVRLYKTRIKTRPTNAFSYNLNVATLVAGGEELDVIVYVRKSSAAPCVATAIADRIGCPLETVDDIANADA